MILPITKSLIMVFLSYLVQLTDKYQSVKVNSSEESIDKDKNPMQNKIALPMVPLPPSDSTQKPSYDQTGDWTTVTRKKKPK